MIYVRSEGGFVKVTCILIHVYVNIKGYKFMSFGPFKKPVWAYHIILKGHAWIFIKRKER